MSLPTEADADCSTLDQCKTPNRVECHHECKTRPVSVQREADIGDYLVSIIKQ